MDENHTDIAAPYLLKSQPQKQEESGPLFVISAIPSKYLGEFLKVSFLPSALKSHISEGINFLCIVIIRGLNRNLGAEDSFRFLWDCLCQ